MEPDDPLQALFANGPSSVALRRGAAASPLEAAWGLDALRGRLVELSAHAASATLSVAFELVLEAQRLDEPAAWILISEGESAFFPPDVAAMGVDLEALVVVRVANATVAASAAARLLRGGGFGLAVIDLTGASAAEMTTANQGRLVGLAQTHAAAVVCLTEKAADLPSLGSLVSLRIEAQRASRAPSELEAGVSDADLRDAVDAAHAPPRPMLRIVPGDASVRDGARASSPPMLRVVTREANAEADGATTVARDDPSPALSHVVTMCALKDKRRGPGWDRARPRRGPPGL